MATATKADAAEEISDPASKIETAESISDPPIPDLVGHQEEVIENVSNLANGGVRTRKSMRKPSVKKVEASSNAQQAVVPDTAEVVRRLTRRQQQIANSAAKREAQSLARSQRQAKRAVTKKPAPSELRKPTEKGVCVARST